MIRQHFYPKNNIRKHKEILRHPQPEIENLPPPQQQLTNQTIINNLCVFIQPELTEPMVTEPIKKTYKRRHNSMLKPIQSLILYHNEHKNKKRNDISNFLLYSRRKQICGVAKRSMSTAHRQKSDIHSNKVQHTQFLDFEELDRKMLSKKKKERTPLTMRFKFNSPQAEIRGLETKVKGWETFADEFVDFT